MTTEYARRCMKAVAGIGGALSKCPLPLDHVGDCQVGPPAGVAVVPSPNADANARS